MRNILAGWLGVVLLASSAAGDAVTNEAAGPSAAPLAEGAVADAETAAGQEDADQPAEAEVAPALVDADPVASADPPEPDADPPPQEPTADDVPTPVAPPAAAEVEAPGAAAVRVRVDLDVRGELFAPTGRDSPPVRQPIAVEARFDFTERREPARATTGRIYAEAKAVIRVDGLPQEVALGADARRVEVALQGTTPTPYLADAFLTRDEADLLDTPFDSLLLDRLLPADHVAIHDAWAIPADAAAGMLAIDTIESGGLEAKLVAVEDGAAQVRLTGIVDGAVDGVPTHLAVEGDCTFTAEAAARDDAPAGWRLLAPRVVAVTIRERRQAGHVAPGLDVEARVSVARHPLAATAVGAAPAVEPGDVDSIRRRGTGRPGLVWHDGRERGYDLVADARWRVVEDGPAGLVMRYVDRGALVGQCSLTVLPRGDALAPATIAEVQRDLERSLAGQFGRFAHASEATRSDGVRIVRVAAEGTAENRPFRWIHHVLTDARGRRAAVTFMLESAAEKRFGTADRELVDGLGFPAEPEADRPGESPADRAARVPRETVTP